MPMCFCVCNQVQPDKVKEVIPSDFNFSFSFLFTRFNDYKVSTFDSTYKTVVGDNDTVIKVVFTEEDKLKVYDTLMKYEYMKLPDTVINDPPCSMPEENDSLVVEANSKMKTIYLTGGPCREPAKPVNQRFNSIRNTIMNILFSKKEVERLPKSNRGAL